MNSHARVYRSTVYVGLCEVVADTIPHSIHAMPDIRPAVISISGLNGAKLSPAPYLPDQGHSREFTVVDNNRVWERKSTDSEVIGLHVEHYYSSMLPVGYCRSMSKMYVGLHVVISLQGLL